ncbi:MAG TPA: cation:proton antiporter [Pseudomonadota bacterium]|nr:cation:proton antiporter [Pseudomonadota bacterium]
MEALLHSPLSRFIAQAVFIVATARVLGFVLRRIGQPMVIAEVVAGIVLGPSLLGWLWPQFFAALFPGPSIALLSMVAQVGLVLFMFLVGLELDFGLLRGRGHASVVISNASIVLPFALGAGLAVFLYPRLSTPSVPLASFVLFMGAAMSITAFPVLARILSERRLLQTKIGAISITSAAINDVTAWCMLAFVVSIVRSAGLSSAALTTLYTGLYLAVMLGLVRPLLARLAARSLGRDGISHNVVAATLVALFVSSFVTELIGIHALFGAFLLGAILPKGDGFAATLTEKLEDLVLVFLLPLFFAVSGLRTQIGLLSSANGFALCGLIILVACVGKFGSSALAARFTGHTWRESSAIGVLMNTRGLMELVVLNMALDLGVISPTLFTMMVLMALLTTFITSPLLQVIYPQAVQTRELAASSLDPDPPSQKSDPPVSVAPIEPVAQPGYVVLMCVAFERSGPAMVTLGSALLPRPASGHHAEESGRLYALRLIPPSDRLSSYVGGPAPAPSSAISGLTPLLQRAGELGASVRSLSFISPRPGHDICNVAEVKGASLVLLGWHKPVLSGNVLGGTVREVLANAPMEVAVLIDRGLTQLRRILVLYHGTPHDLAAVHLAQRIYQASAAHAAPPMVTLFSVVAASQDAAVEEAALLTRFAALFPAPAAPASSQSPTSPGLHITVVPHTEPAEAALAEAQSPRGGPYDLVLVGIGPDWGLEQRSLGIASEPLLQRCPGSVLILRARKS